MRYDKVALGVVLLLLGIVLTMRGSFMGIPLAVVGSWIVISDLDTNER